MIFTTSVPPSARLCTLFSYVQTRRRINTHPFHLLREPVFMFNGLRSTLGAALVRVLVGSGTFPLATLVVTSGSASLRSCHAGCLRTQRANCSVPTLRTGTHLCLLTPHKVRQSYASFRACHEKMRFLPPFRTGSRHFSRQSLQVGFVPYVTQLDAPLGESARSGLRHSTSGHPKLR